MLSRNPQSFRIASFQLILALINLLFIHCLGLEFYLYCFQLQTQRNTVLMEDPHTQIEETYFGGAWKPQTTSQMKQCLLNSAEWMKEALKKLGISVLSCGDSCCESGDRMLIMTRLIKLQHSFTRKWQVLPDVHRLQSEMTLLSNLPSAISLFLALRIYVFLSFLLKTHCMKLTRKKFLMIICMTDLTRGWNSPNL